MDSLTTVVHSSRYVGDELLRLTLLHLRAKLIQVASSFRKFHQPWLYDIAMDDKAQVEFLETLLYPPEFPTTSTP